MRRWLFLAVAVAGLALAAAVVAVRWWPQEGADHPDAWDPRVEEYAEIAADERGLEFKHPIHVDFLSAEEFKEQVTEDKEDLTEEDREELEQTTGLLRALGLIEGDVDLFEVTNQLRSSGIVGLYSDEDERIRIRGTELTPNVESTLVHELTHALQDQHFDIGARYDELDESDDSAAASAYRALVEGDASRVETAWRQGLDEEDQAALEESRSEELQAFEEESEGIPQVLEVLMSAPYVFGEALLQVAVQEGGDGAVDELFESPPTTEEHQLDPWTLVEDDQEPLEVPAPTLEEDEEEFDDGAFGAISWMLVLAERIPVRQALAAADGWGGDSYVAFDRDGVSCVRINYQGDTATDLAEMRAALRAWSRRLPDAPADVQVSSDGDQLVFESCDPGAQATSVSTGGSRGAVRLALTRTYLSAGLVGAGLDSEAARCGAERLLDRFTPAELNGPDVDPVRVRQIVAPCLA